MTEPALTVREALAIVEQHGFDGADRIVTEMLAPLIAAQIDDPGMRGWALILLAGKENCKHGKR